MSKRSIEAAHFSQDIQELIRAFQQNEVRFLVVGGEAVIFHGYPRFTGDVDFHYDPSLSNSKRLFQALLDFWDGDVPGIASAQELTDVGLVLQFGRPPNRIDLLSKVSGVDFETAWSRRVRASFEDAELPYLALTDLIAAKRAAGRPKDLQDLLYLERLQESGEFSEGKADF